MTTYGDVSPIKIREISVTDKGNAFIYVADDPESYYYIFISREIRQCSTFENIQHPIGTLDYRTVLKILKREIEYIKLGKGDEWTIKNNYVTCTKHKQDVNIEVKIDLSGVLYITLLLRPMSDGFSYHTSRKISILEDAIKSTNDKIKELSDKIDSNSNRIDLMNKTLGNIMAFLKSS